MTHLTTIDWWGLSTAVFDRFPESDWGIPERFGLEVQGRSEKRGTDAAEEEEA